MPPHWGSIFGFLDQRPTANRATSRSRYPAYFKLPSTDLKTLPTLETSTLIFQNSFRSRKPRQPHARLSSNTGTSASLRPSPPLRRSADNRRLCPPKSPRLQSKARPDIITVIIRPRLFRTNQTCPHVTEKTVNQTEKEGRHRCHENGDIPPFYAHDLALKAPSRTVRQYSARPRPPALYSHLSRTFENQYLPQRTPPGRHQRLCFCRPSALLFAPRTPHIWRSVHEQNRGR